MTKAEILGYIMKDKRIKVINRKGKPYGVFRNLFISLS